MSAKRPNRNNDGLGRTVLALLALVLAYFLLPALLQASGAVGESAGHHIVEKQEQRRAESSQDNG